MHGTPNRGGYTIISNFSLYDEDLKVIEDCMNEHRWLKNKSQCLRYILKYYADHNSNK